MALSCIDYDVWIYLSTIITENSSSPHFSFSTSNIQNEISFELARCFSHYNLIMLNREEIKFWSSSTMTNKWKIISNIIFDNMWSTNVPNINCRNGGCI